ncbi:Endothelin-converting enzyme 2 [Tyrophagus putrescentiae]|nr:Endothelin-converting enzyme 2 [Tyrophagus putrescentiae]
MNTLQLKPMAGYRREELLDGDDDDETISGNNNSSSAGHHLVFSSNLTSIGNPHFSSSRTLMLDDAQPTATEELLTSSSSPGGNQNSTTTAAVLKDLGLLGGQQSPQRTSNQQQQQQHHLLRLLHAGGGGHPMENFSISFISNGAYHQQRKRFFWDRLTHFERLLSLVIFLLGLVIITLAVTLLVQPTPVLQVHLNKDGLHPQPQPCLTPKCISIASSIIESLDPSVDPCVNFYEYSCGGKRKFSGAELKAKIYYESCLDRNNTLEKLKEKPLQDFIDLIGGWNISGGFDVRAWNLQSKLTVMHNRYNRGGLFEWSVAQDEKNSSRMVLDLQQGGFVMPRDYYMNKTDDDPIMVAYLEFMVKIGVLLGGEEASTRAQMKDVLRLERAMAKILIPPEQMRDDQKTYHKMTLAELTALSPFLNWAAYFREAFLPVGRNITDAEPIIVYSPEYMGNLSALITDYQRTDYNKTVLVNSIVWSVVQPLVSYLSKPFREAAKTFSQVLVGGEGTTSKWRYCIGDTGSVMGFALGSMFVRASFRGESKSESEVMIAQIKAAFREHLSRLDWMDPHTLVLAMEKADAITDMIGFPDFILNAKKLNKRYEGLVVKEEQYFNNAVNSNRFVLNEYVRKLDKPANKSEWDMPPPVVNAYYAPSRNQIAFPAGILQAPFYDVARPRALNFGAMGVVMGHELSHAFDDQGREYDKKGNLNEWWDERTIARFKEKMTCFQEQYSGYHIDKDHVNGRQTMGENIADNGGIQTSFRAFRRWLDRQPGQLDSPLLPGLNYSTNQLFFIGFAQVWCSVNTPEALKLQLRNDPHTPSEYRVIGTLSNTAEFSNAFSCPPGSPMNPVKKCAIW